MKKILITLILFMGIILNTKAMTIKPTGGSTSGRGGTVEVYITLTRTSSEKTISAVDGTLSYDENVLTLQSHESLMGNNWTELGDVANGKAFSFANLQFNALISETNKNIAKLTFKVKDNATFGNTNITISNPTATDENADGVDISGGSHTIKIVSNVDTLSSITIDGEGISNFNSNTLNYNVEVEETKSKVTIGATKTDTNATMTGDIGERNLDYGVNTFKITVTSEAQTTKVYTINITRKDNRSSVNTLKSLSLSSGTIANFSPTTTTYNVTVEENIDKVTISSELTDTKSKYVSGYGNRQVSLNTGSNTVLIKVEAENGSVRTYTINITRKGVVTPTPGTSNNDENNDGTEVDVPYTGLNVGQVIGIISIIMLIYSVILIVYGFRKKIKEK